MKLTKFIPVVGLAVALPTLALAQDDAPATVAADEFVWIMNSLLFLIGGFLVLLLAYFGSKAVLELILQRPA